MRIPKGYQLQVVSPGGIVLANIKLDDKELNGQLTRAIIFSEVERSIEANVERTGRR